MSGESGVSLPNNTMVRPIGLGMGPLELRFRTPHTPKTHTPRLFKGLQLRGCEFLNAPYLSYLRAPLRYSASNLIVGSETQGQALSGYPRTALSFER